MTPSSAEQALYEDLLSIYARAGAEVTYETDAGEIKPYWAKRYLSALKRAEKNGEILAFAERLAGAPDATRGFLILKKAGRLDLTVEALVCDRGKPYWGEFDADVLEVARRRLADHGFDTLRLPSARRNRRLRSGSLRGELETRLPEDADGMQARAKTIAMLRADDEIGLRELLLSERRRFERTVISDLQAAGDRLGQSTDPEALKPLEQSLWFHVDRRLGSLLPLLEYRSGALEEDGRALATLAERLVPTRATPAAWRQGTRWPVWLITLIAGTTAVALDRPDVVVGMWRRRTRYADNRPLPVSRLEGGAELGEALLHARPATGRVPELWYPAFAAWDSELLREHYPEIMRGSETPDAVLGFLSRAGDFLWLCDALAGRDRIEATHLWAASQVHSTLRARLADDAELAGRYAAALGEDPRELISTLSQWISAPVTTA